jgi:hypothetical protein
MQVSVVTSIAGARLATAQNRSALPSVGSL